MHFQMVISPLFVNRVRVLVAHVLVVHIVVMIVEGLVWIKHWIAIIHVIRLLCIVDLILELLICAGHESLAVSVVCSHLISWTCPVNLFFSHTMMALLIIKDGVIKMVNHFLCFFVGGLHFFCGWFNLLSHLSLLGYLVIIIIQRFKVLFNILMLLKVHVIHFLLFFFVLLIINCFEELC